MKPIIYYCRTDCDDLSAAAYMLLRQVSGFGGEIARRKYGKPYFVARTDLQFNLSHTKGMVVCALADTPVGVDVEHPRAVRSGLATRYFTEAERGWAKNDPVCMLTIWTRKEALLKRSGCGVTCPLNTIETYGNSNIFSYRRGDFTISFCGDEEPELREAVLTQPSPVSIYTEQKPQPQADALQKKAVYKANGREGCEMLENLDVNKVMEKEAWDTVADGLKNKLSTLQQQARAAKLPVVIVFEGWEASGKGSLISRLINNLDPRGFSVYSILPPTADEQRYPWMRRFWKKLPVYGDIAIFDRSWYQQVAIYEPKQDAKVRARRYREIMDFEKQITDDGYLLIKFFLHISKKEQKRRFEALEDKKETSWRVSKQDWKQHDKYDEQLARFSEMIELGNQESARWTTVEATDRRFAAYKVFTTVINEIERALNEKKTLGQAPFTGIRTSGDIQPLQIPLLADINPNQPLSEEEYRIQLKAGQKRLFELHNQLYQAKIPMVLAYEGWDAAGKGGNIKRVTQSLDPRGYEVIPIAAPLPAEKNRQHLWRFWNALPRDGHIAVFDRTWYGRVMVEHIEGFCTEEQWGRAYDEINRFEKQLAGWGAIILKFWLQIDKDEQLRRFEDRQNTPEKQYKITDEDWRNREKWDAYEQAVNEMLARTNTAYAPWIVVESNNKHYARVKALQETILAIEARLAEEKKR